MSGENKGKYKTLFVPIEKEITKTDKDGYESIVTISYKIKFIDSARFMANSLSNLVDNLVKEFANLIVNIVTIFLNMKVLRTIWENINDYLAIKIIQTKFGAELKRFKNTFKFSNNDINKFILLLRKGVYSYEYIDELEKFNKTTLHEIEEF